MRRIAALLTLTASLLGGSYAYAADLPNYTAYFDAPALRPVASHGAEQARAFGIVTSMDKQTGIPSWVWGSRELKQILPMTAGVPAERVHGCVQALDQRFVVGVVHLRAVQRQGGDASRVNLT